MKKKIESEQARLENLLKAYTEKVSVNLDRDRISESDGEKLFTLIVQDYVKGIVSVDNLSSLCEMSYSKLDIKTELHSLLLMGAEVEWYIRHKPLIAAGAIEDLIRKFAKESLDLS